MTEPWTVLCATGAVTVLLMLSVWLLSLVKRDASIVDIFWGVGFAAIAAVAGSLGDGFPARRHLVAVLTVVWGLRLAVYLLWRNWGQGEDFRYRTFRQQYGERFWWVSLFLVFGLQAVLMWIVSLPVQIAELSALPARLTWLDAAGSALWAVGLVFEVVGDWQLARFKRDAANRGTVLDRGLWRYTRHPNYFGDAVLWWGFFLIALGTPAGVWAIIGPVVMTIFLMRVSGVPLLERKLLRTRPAYRDYVQRTSAFFPWFPKY